MPFYFGRDWRIKGPPSTKRTALKKVSSEIETVFSLGLIMRVDENGFNPALNCLDDLGIPRPHRGKVNVGLGKPLSLD